MFYAVLQNQTKILSNTLYIHFLLILKLTEFPQAISWWKKNIWKSSTELCKVFYMFFFFTKDPPLQHYHSVSDSILKWLEWMLAENTPQRKNKTSGTETEHNLNTERFKETVIQKEEEDLFSLTSQIAPRTVCTVCLPPQTAIPQRILRFLSLWPPSKTSPTQSPNIWTPPC